MKTPRRANPHRPALRKLRLRAGILTIACALGASGCASTVIEAESEAPEEVLPKAVPDYAGVPHPMGLQLGDVRALFEDPKAPRLESDEMKACTADYRALEAKTKSREEQKQGILELVRREPIRYHWCFYATLLQLESQLRQAQMLDERQKTVVEAYRFLAPLARVFQREYRDSRYLRWAVSYYRRASEIAFYRRVEASPGLTQELVGMGQESDDPKRGIAEQSTSVLHKYGIVVPDRLQPGQSADSVQSGEMLPNDAYVQSSELLPDTAVAPKAEPARSPASTFPATEGK